MALKINKEYKDQKVVCFFPDGSSIKLDIATQDELKKVYTVKGYQKFLDSGKDETKDDEKKPKK